MEWWKRYKTSRKQAKCECNDFEHHRARTFWHYKIKDRRVLGVTLSWGGGAVPYEETDLECDWCGRAFSRRGYSMTDLWRRWYPPDHDGWPTLNGERLPIWNPEAARQE